MLRTLGIVLICLVVILAGLYWLLKKLLIRFAKKVAQKAFDSEAFTRALHEYFDGLGKPIEIHEDGSVTFKNEADRESVSVIYLGNLIRRCVNQPSANYAQIIANHFSKSVEQLQEVVGDLEKLTSSWAIAQESVAIRICNDSYIKTCEEMINTKKHVMERPMGPDLHEVVVMDLPDTIHALFREDVQSWGIDEDEIFKRAKANTRHLVEAEQGLEDVDGLKVYYFHNPNNHYVASVMLWIDEYPEAHGRYGSLVGIPARGHLAMMLINGLEDTERITYFAKYVLSVHEELPGAITPNIFWYYKEAAMAFEWKEGEKGQVTLDAPDPFKLLVKSLREGTPVPEWIGNWDLLRDNPNKESC